MRTQTEVNVVGRPDPIATAALRRVQETITTRPELLDMEIWVGKDIPRCGTVGCIAAHLAMQEGWTVRTRDEVLDLIDPDRLPGEVRKGVKRIIASRCWQHTADCEDAVTAFLRVHGCGERGFSHLFVTNDWPEPFKSSYESIKDANEADTLSDADTAIALARITADRIEHFIQTGE